MGPRGKHKISVIRNFTAPFATKHMTLCFVAVRQCRSVYDSVRTSSVMYGENPGVTRFRCYTRSIALTILHTRGRGGGCYNARFFQDGDGDDFVSSSTMHRKQRPTGFTLRDRHLYCDADLVSCMRFQPLVVVVVVNKT